MQTLPGGVPVSPVLLSLCCVCVNSMCPESSFCESPCGIWPMDVDVSLHPGRICLSSLLVTSTSIFHRTHLGAWPFPTYYTDKEGPFCSPQAASSLLCVAVPTQLCHIHAPQCLCHCYELWINPRKDLRFGALCPFHSGAGSDSGAVWTVLTLTPVLCLDAS